MSRSHRIVASALLFVLAFAGAVAAASSQHGRHDAEIIYGHKHGMALTFDVFYPTVDAKGAAVLFMASGGWFSRWAPLARGQRQHAPLLAKGFTVFTVRHGSSPKYLIPEIVPDVRRAVRYIRLHADDFGIDPERIGVSGGSAGGHLSLMLATASDEGDPDAGDQVDRIGNRIAAVVAYFAPVDLRGTTPDTRPGGAGENNERFPALNFDGTLEAEFSPLVHVSSDDPPTLLIHGDQDDLVSIRHSYRMRDALDRAGVANRLIVIEGSGHGFRGEDAVRAREAMVDWFERHLLR